MCFRGIVLLFSFAMAQSCAAHRRAVLLVGAAIVGAAAVAMVLQAGPAGPGGAPAAPLLTELSADSSRGQRHASLTGTEREELEDILRRKEDRAIKTAEAKIEAKMLRTHPHKSQKAKKYKFRPEQPKLDMWSFAE